MPKTGGVGGTSWIAGDLVDRRGATAEEIAEDRRRSVDTIRTHIRDLYDRLVIGLRLELPKLTAESAEEETGR